MKRPAALAIALLMCACTSNSNKTLLSPGKSSLALDGLVYNQRFNCSQSFTGGAPFCADQDVSDQIQFTKTGTNTYQARDVPDNGYLYTGSTSGITFTWTGTSPNGYTETGTWTFSADGATFSGTSHYVANDNSYAGDCASTGARAPATPATPAAVGVCP